MIRTGGRGKSGKRKATKRNGLEEFFQKGPPLTEWAVFEVGAVEVEEVECVVHQRPTGGKVRAVLEHLKGRLSLVVNHDGLAVQNERALFDFRNVGGDFGEFPREVVATAGEQAHFFAVLNGLETVPVEFEFVLPVGAIGQRANEPGKHWGNKGGGCHSALIAPGWHDSNSGKKD